MSTQPPNPDELQRDDEAGIDALLREVGARDEPSQTMTDDVRRAVQAEWKTVVDTRLRRRRFIQYGMAASIVGVTAAIAITWRSVAVEPYHASVARIDGSVEIVSTDGQRRMAIAGQSLSVGDTLRTSETARIAFDFDNGVVARMDTNSEATFEPNRFVSLAKGAVYVDAAPTNGGSRELTIKTPFGSVRHIGTQYQARLLNDGLEVGVREGRIEVASHYGTNTGSAGERLHFSINGNVTRAGVSHYDESWQWTSSIAPVFHIENRSLADFLMWAARETGRTLIFDSAQAKAAAAVKLRGSIDGLDVNTALTAVLSTTQLQLIKTNDESMKIALKSAIESPSLERPTP